MQAPDLDPLSVIADRLKLLATHPAETWWDIGSLLDTVATSPGVADYAAFARRVAGIDRTDARRMRSVAHVFSRDLALRFGLDKLELLLQVVDASREACHVIDPLRVHVLRKGPGRSSDVVPFAEASLDDLRFTLRILVRRRAVGDRRFDRAVAALRDELDASLVQMLARKAPRVRIGANLARSLDGNLCLSDIRPEDLEAVGKVLIAVGKRNKKRPRA
ncbi:MAG TPA: hypothetical protein PLI95_17460 [Polyangiaceae bacterium]|nr:hypothetical protein [Polyangiaceae bacterium]